MTEKTYVVTVAGPATSAGLRSAPVGLLVRCVEPPSNMVRPVRYQRQEGHAPRDLLFAGAVEPAHEVERQAREAHERRDIPELASGVSRLAVEFALQALTTLRGVHHQEIDSTLTRHVAHVVVGALREVLRVEAGE